MNFERYTDFIPSAREKAKDFAKDVSEGISVIDRYVVTRNVKTRTVVTDTANGKRLVDTEDSYTREFSLFKVILSALAIFVSAVICFSSLRRVAQQRKQIKEQKKELRQMKKLCKKADIELPEN